MAARHPGFSVPPLETREPVSEREYTISDVNGVVRCQVSVTKSQRRSSFTDDGSIRGQKLFRCILRTGEGDPSEEFDLCEFARSIDPDLQVILSDSTYPYYSPQENQIVLRGVSNAFGIYTFLHELGHVLQSKDPRFQAIDRYYGLTNTLARSLSREVFFIDVQQLRRQIVVIERISKIDGLVQRAEPFLVRLSALERSVKELNASSNPEERKRCFAAGRGILEEMKSILDVPSKILERDANSRMLQMLRYLKGMGIDLFGVYTAQKESVTGVLAGEGVCEASSRRAVSSVSRMMNAYLASYHATTANMRTSYGAMPFMEKE